MRATIAAVTSSRVRPPLRLATAALALLLPLALAGCGEDDPSTVAAPSAAASAPAPASSAAPSAEAGQEADTESAQLVSLTVAGGKVTGDTGRVSVEEGARVRITVLADVADEVHLHGYDLMQTTSVGSPAVLEFIADRPGVFEVELEGAGLPLTRLAVQ
ncbi:MAG: hypothetical protein JWM64_489 [Frankiales bacterium]|nr:hypothetical protein [Frankiales bacterium]